MADEPKKDNAELDKTLSPSDEVADPDKAQGDELNTTMMAIDVSKLGTDVTKTDIKVQAPKSPTDDDIIREQLEEKKSPLVRLFGQVFGRKKKAARVVNLPRVLEPYLHFWVCDPNETLAFQLFFYALRLAIIVLAITGQSILGQEVVESFRKLHPERLLFAVIFAVELFLTLYFLLRKKSPGWLVTWPLTALALIMVYGAIFYHTADRDYFTLVDGTIADHLNEFYMLVFLYVGIMALFGVIRQFLLRSLLALLLVAAIAAMALNLFLNVRLEQSFFGPGLLAKIPLDYLQPVWLSLQIVTPLLLLFLAVYALKPGGKSSLDNAVRSMARSLAVLLFFVTVLNLALLQKNRVFHVLNLVLPQRLDVGGIEFKYLNQNLKIITKNFVANEGRDSKSRYRFHVRYAKKKKMFLLQVEDVFGFPVKNLGQADFLVTSDDKKITTAGITEDRALDLEKGNYWIKLELTPKSDVVRWQLERRSYLPQEEIGFELTQPDKLGRVVVKYGDEVLLEVKSPKSSNTALPLGYFRDGIFKLNVLAYDALDQEIFQKDLDVHVVSAKDLAILFPRSGDVVGSEVAVVTRLTGVPAAGVKSMSYYFRDQLLGHFDELGYFQLLDLSAMPDGQGTLKVVADTGTEQISQLVDIDKGTPVASLRFTEPPMGVFAERDMPVSYGVSGSGAQVVGVKVFVNGSAFADFVVKDQGFTLPVSRWQMSEIYVVLTASLTNGQNVSDWVQINRGMSELELKFDPATLGFLNVSKVAVILDASVSSWDNWQNKSKWQAMSNVILAPDVENKLALLNPSFFVFGSQKPYYYYDCADAHDLLEKRSYNKALLKRILEKIQPSGVAALAKAFDLAYKTRPDMIFAFADSSDYCTADLVSVLRTSAGQSPSTRVFLISLGRVHQKDQKELIRLAESTGGRYMQPEDYTALTKMLIEDLVLNYELHSQDKFIAKLPLEDKSFHLGPGNYILKIPYGAKVQEVPLKLEHGTRTALAISGKKVESQNKIHIQQSVQQLQDQ